MPVVSIESPYSAPTSEGLHRNQLYAMLCVQYATKCGYAPYASHLISTVHWRKFADEGCANPYVGDTGYKPEYHVIGREAAIKMTHDVRRKCDECWFFLDFGETPGMTDARVVCAEAGIETRDIMLGEESEEWASALDTIRQLSA